MNKLTLSLLLSSLLLGNAHAESGVSPGYDRVGLAGDKPALVQATRMAAPGESRRDDTAATPDRRREMARRLVWLMLSAR
jgi:hypothetical protein